MKRNLAKKVDLSSSINKANNGMMADVNMNMNGMGVYMNVIRDSQKVSAKKELLSK